MSFNPLHLSSIVGLLGALLLSASHLLAYDYTVQPIAPNGQYNAGHSTAITSYGHTSYTAWIEGSTLKAGKVALDGSVQSVTVRTNIQQNLYHVMPSIALDKDGYIHVTADMHNQDWVYYISNQPYDVQSGFTQHLPGTAQCPPGQTITYPEFFSDKQGGLYVAFRHRISRLYPNPTGSQPGNVAGAVARYDADSKTWTMLGGQNVAGYPSGAGDETDSLFWSPTGTMDGGYGGWFHQPRPWIFFDDNDRMHVIATMALTDSQRTWNGMSHLLYAYSDDYGDTFHKVDGTPIATLPLTKDNATVIEDRSATGDLVAGARVGAFDTNTPVVSYQHDGGRFSKKWNGSAWVDVPVPNIASGVYTRRNGEAVYFRPYMGVYRSTDGGQTFQQISHGFSYGHGNEKIDYAYFIKTGHLRFQAISNATSETQIHTFWVGDVDPRTAGPNLTHGVVSNVSSETWTQVEFGQVYDEAVVVGTLVLPDTSWTSTTLRVRNVTDVGCEIRIEKLNGYTPEVTRDVHLTTVEAGVYTVAEDGVKMEAARFNSTRTNRKYSWNGQSVSLSNSYTSPVVVGQVMTANDNAWSQFWAFGSSQFNSPTTTNLKIGKHVGEDSNKSRANETLGYIIFDAGSGTINGLNYQAGITSDSIRGADNTSTGYNTGISVPNATTAILSQTRMDGGDGGFAVLHGATPVTDTQINMVIDEDTLNDSERAHTEEPVSFLVIGE